MGLGVCCKLAKGAESRWERQETREIGERIRTSRVAWALAEWLIWLEHSLVHQKVAGLIPSQGTYLGFWFDPQSHLVQEATD